MTVTLADLMTETLQRLGDSNAEIWDGGEIRDYIQIGYDDMTRRTGCLLGLALAPDYPSAFTYTYPWEIDDIPASGYANGPFNFTSEFERDLVDNGNGPANHNYLWEFYDTANFIAPTEISALVDLPEDLHEIERSTWNSRSTTALRSRDVEWTDQRYELNRGQVEATIQDKDGINRLRKWRVPAAAYEPYSFDASSDDGFGIIRDLTGIADVTVISDGFGDLVQVDGVDIFESFGILGPIYRETGNLKMEYRRRGLLLSDDQAFEIPDRYTVYLRHYAQGSALAREGNGQDLELSAHFLSRYEAGISRMLKRKQAMAYQQVYVMGGGRSNRGQKPPRPRLPWPYPVVR